MPPPPRRARRCSPRHRRGKHIYCEKPVATNLEEAVADRAQGKAAGIKHGVVQDKLFLPGLRKLKLLIDSGFFGRILSVRGEFGYWVFEGDLQPTQRRPWNYRSRTAAASSSTCCATGATCSTTPSATSVGVLPRRTSHPRAIDEDGKRYKATTDDAGLRHFQLEGGIIAHFNCSWATRVRRDDLLTLHVDGTHGSAVAGLQDVVTQQRMATPKPVWNPDVKQPIDFYAGWQPVPETQAFDNGFKLQWEAFIRHVAEDAPYKWDLVEGAKGVQLVECALRSWKERRWVDVPELKV
jgi:predicted dehydrogenase